VADRVFVVLSEPPAGVSEEEFNAWYDLHVRQILELPGWVAAERYGLRFVNAMGEAPSQSYSYCVRYEVEGDFDAAWKALRTAVDTGQMEMPEWLSGFTAAGWEGWSLGGRVLAEDPDVALGAKRSG
jgi:hypothetical protein